MAHKKAHKKKWDRLGHGDGRLSLGGTSSQERRGPVNFSSTSRSRLAEPVQARRPDTWDRASARV